MSGRARWFRRLAFLVLGLAVVYAGLRLGLGAYANRRLEGEIARIREAGGPLRFEDVAPGAAEANGIPELVGVGDGLRKRTDAVDEAIEALRLDPLALSDEDVATLQPWVEAGGPALEALDRALERPVWRFVPDWSSAMNMELEGVWDLIALRELLEVRGLLELRTDDVEAALGTAELLLSASARMGEEPLLILELVRQTVQGSALRILAWTLRTEPPSRSRLDRMRGALTAVAGSRPARDFVLAERCYASTAFYESLEAPNGLDLLMGFGTLPWHRALLLRLFPEAMIRLDHARWLALSREAVAWVDRPWPETRDAWPQRLDALREENPWYELASTHAFATAALIPERVAKHESRVRALALAMTIEARALEHGALPTTLDALDSVPTDPLTGEPFGYELTHEGRGYRIPGAALPDAEDEAFERPPRT